MLCFVSLCYNIVIILLMGLRDKILRNTPVVMGEITPPTLKVESNPDSVIFKIEKIINALKIVDQNSRESIKKYLQTQKNIKIAREEISEIIKEVNSKTISEPLTLEDVLSDEEYAKELEIRNLKTLEESSEFIHKLMVNDIGKRARVIKYAFKFLTNHNPRIKDKLNFQEIISQLEKEKEVLTNSTIEDAFIIEETIPEYASDELIDEIESLHEPKIKKTSKPLTDSDIADGITIHDRDLKLFSESNEGLVTSEIKRYYKRFFGKNLKEKYDREGLNDVDFIIEKINKYQEDIDTRATEVNVLKMRVLRLAKKINRFFDNTNTPVVDTFLDHITNLGLTPVEAFLSNKSVFTSPVTFMGPKKLDHKSDPTQILDDILKKSKNSFDQLLKSKNWQDIDTLYDFSRLDNLIKQQGVFYEELETMFETSENVLLNIDLDSIKETQEIFQKYNKKDQEENSKLPIFLKEIKPNTAKKINGLSLEKLIDFQKDLENKLIAEDNALEEFIDNQVDYKIAKAKEEKFKKENAEAIKEIEKAERSKSLLQEIGNEYFEDVLISSKHIQDDDLIVSHDFIVTFSTLKLHKEKTYNTLISEEEEYVKRTLADIENIKNKGQKEGDGVLNSKKRAREARVKYHQDLINTSNKKIDSLKTELLKLQALDKLNDLIKKIVSSNFGKLAFTINEPLSVNEIIDVIKKIIVSHELTPTELKLKDALIQLENNTLTSLKKIPIQEPPLKNSTPENKPITQKKPSVTLEVGKEHKITEERYQELNRKFLSYQDAAYESNPLFTKELAAEYRERGLKSDNPNKRGGAAVLDRLIKHYGEKKMIEVAIKMIAECKEVLNKVHSKHSVFLSSMTWALWDISKQIYFNEHPELTNKNYRTGNALEDPQIMRDLIDRHIGWEVVGGGNIDALNLNKNHPTYKMIRNFIEMVNKKEHISSWQLTKIGQAVRENIASLG